MEMGEGMAVGVWEGEEPGEDEGGMEEVGTRQPEQKRGKWGDDKERGRDDNRTVDGGRKWTQRRLLWRGGEGKVTQNLGDGRAGRVCCE